MMHNSSTPRKKTRRGFTLLEALVAVIGVSILAVGLSTIFSSISKTVTTGRRISAINNHAAVIERMLRRDFESMTREGFLVIRNEYANVTRVDLSDPDRFAIPLSAEAIGSRRMRRIDEIMFFSRGEFESARTPLDSDYVARSNSARIYYGHGQEQLEGTVGHATPFLDETNENSQLRLGLSGATNGIGDINPNYFASDWTLLRHVTLLKVPQLHPVNQAGPLGLSPSVSSALSLFQDNELQIAGQPAAAGIFRVETTIGRPFENDGFDAGTDGSFASFNLREEVVSPLFESGVVDVATTSLNEIKRRMTTIYAREPFTPFAPGGSPSPVLEFYAGTPGDVFLLSNNFDANRGFFTSVPLYSPQDNVYSMSQSEFLDYRFGLQAEDFVLGAPFAPNTPFATPLGQDDNVTGLQALVHVQHAWMSDALPGRSNERLWEGEDDWEINPSYSASWRGTSTTPALTGAPPPYPSDRNVYEFESARTRMRTEKSPPGYNADVFSPDAAENYNEVQWAAYRGDQQIVGASQFIPRCTEFIVEWSLGQIDSDTSEVIWYGHDPDGIVAPDRAGAVRHLRPQTNRPDPFASNEIFDLERQDDIEKHLLADLINGLVTETGTSDADSISERPHLFPLTHYFGYADPRAVPIDFNNDGVADAYDMNDDGIADDIDGDGNLLENEWPWPKLVRITMSFADPVDQSIEETFQFVIEIPDGQGI